MKCAKMLCVVILLAVSGVAHGQPAAAQKLPEQVVVFAEIHNMVSVGQKLQNLAMAIDPNAVIPALAQVAPAALLKTMNPAAVDLQKPFQVVILAPPLHRSVVLVFSVADPQTYLGSLLPGIQKVKDEGSLHVYSEGLRPLIIGTVGNRAALGRDQQVVGKVVALMEAGAWTGGPVVEGGDASVVVRLKRLLDALNAAGQNPFDAVRERVLSRMSTASPARVELAQAMLRAELDAVEDLAWQIDTVVTTVSFGEDDLRVTKQTALVPGSGMGQYLAGLSGGELELLRYLPDDSMMVAAGKVGDLGPYVEWYVAFLDEIMPAFGGDGADMGALVQLAREMARTMGDEMAVGMVRSPEGAACLVYAVRTKDRAAMRKLLESSPAALETFFGNQNKLMKMSLKVSPDSHTHGGCRISEWEYEMEFIPLEGTPEGEQVAAMQEQMMEAMYGGEMKAYWTFVDDVWLSTSGVDALDTLRAMIDGKARMDRSRQLAAALTGMPVEPATVGYLALSDLAEWYLHAISKVMVHMPIPVDLEAIAFEPAPGIGFTGRMVGPNVVETRLRIPVAAIRAIVDGFRSMVPAEATLDAY